MSNQDEEAEETTLEQEEEVLETEVKDVGVIISGIIAGLVLASWITSKTIPKPKKVEKEKITEELIELSKIRDVEVTREEDGSISKVLVVEGDKYKVLEVYKDNYGRIRKLSWWGSK